MPGRGVNDSRFVAGQAAFDRLGNTGINRARVRFFLSDTEFGKQLDDGARGYFQLSGQLVDTNHAHKDAVFTARAVFSLKDSGAGSGRPKFFIRRLLS